MRELFTVIHALIVLLIQWWFIKITIDYLKASEVDAGPIMLSMMFTFVIGYYSGRFDSLKKKQ